MSAPDGIWSKKLPPIASMRPVSRSTGRIARTTSWVEQQPTRRWEACKNMAQRCTIAASDVGNPRHFGEIIGCSNCIVPIIGEICHHGIETARFVLVGAQVFKPAHFPRNLIRHSANHGFVELFPGAPRPGAAQKRAEWCMLFGASVRSNRERGVCPISPSAFTEKTPNAASAQRTRFSGCVCTPQSTASASIMRRSSGAIRSATPRSATKRSMRDN